MSTFFRTTKNAENPFVMMDKRPVENPGLSWSAKGMLSYLLSRPDGWKIIMQDLINRSTDGEYAVRNTVKELVEAGHMVKRDVRDDKGHFVEHIYDVYETPTSRFPTSGFPTSGESRTNNTDISNTESNDIVAPLPLLLSIENQIYAGVEKISAVDNTEMAYMDTANLLSMGKGINQPIAYGIAYTFMKTRGIIIPEGKIKGNRKALKEMVDMGVLPNHVQEATKKLMDAKMTVTDLFSIIKTAVALAHPEPETYSGALEGV